MTPEPIVMPVTSRPFADVYELGTPLEFRLKRLHRLHRRALVRRYVAFACWGIGLAGAAAFAVGLTLGVVAR